MSKFCIALKDVCDAIGKKAASTLAARSGLSRQMFYYLINSQHKAHHATAYLITKATVEEINDLIKHHRREIEKLMRVGENLRAAYKEEYGCERKDDDE